MKIWNRISRRGIPLITAMLLLCTACGPKTVAATMRLMKMLGTVQVVDGKGKSLDPVENLSLHSGYQVDTQAESYAWIDLDAVKLTKLDAESEIQIQKEGKKLDIIVNSGSLFFQVTSPLEPDETMNIRTSNMVVGIRGTCGWVRVKNADHMQAYLLEGKVECAVQRPDGSTAASGIVTAGEMAEMTSDGGGSIAVSAYNREDIPSFVMDEINAPGNETLAAAAESLEEEEDKNAVYDSLNQSDRELLDQLVNAVRNCDWTTASQLQMGACSELAGRIPLAADGNYYMDYFPDSETKAIYFKKADEGMAGCHLDLFHGTGGNGERIVSVYEVDTYEVEGHTVREGHYYMNIVRYSDGSANGPLTSYNIGLLEDGEILYYTVTGSLTNSVLDGPVLYTYSTGETFTTEGEGFTVWPDWPGDL